MSEHNGGASGSPAGEGCLVCGAALCYSTVATAQVCDLCGVKQSALISCPDGHFVCDDCHGATALDLVHRVLEATTLCRRRSAPESDAARRGL